MGKLRDRPGDRKRHESREVTRHRVLSVRTAPEEGKAQGAGWAAGAAGGASPPQGTAALGPGTRAFTRGQNLGQRDTHEVGSQRSK